MGRNKEKGCGICGGPVHAKKLCKKHYQRSYRRRPRVRLRQKNRQKFK